MISGSTITFPFMTGKLYLPAMVCLSLFSFNCRVQNVLEHEQVLSFKQAESIKNGVTRLMITGQCGHSALAIDRIETKTVNNSMSVRAYLSLVKNDGKSGTLNIDLEIPHDVNEVRFGKKEILIWKGQ